MRFVGLDGPLWTIPTPGTSIAPAADRDLGRGSQRDWMEAQARLAGISTNGVQRVLDATHESVILDVLAAVRERGRVAP